MGKRDDLMLKVDELACSVLNIKSAIRFALKGNKGIYEKNKQLVLDLGDEDCCFILGNGPSLKKVDFDEIKEYPCFTVNMFYRGTDDYFSKYHLFLDPCFADDNYIEYVRDVCENGKNIKIIGPETLYNRLSGENRSVENIYAISSQFIQCKDKVEFDMSKCMTGSLNVIPVAIECALYMGYKKIYLLGCDFNSYAVCKDEHFYEQKASENVFGRGHEIGDLIRCALVHKQHYAIDDVARSVGCEIVNLTEGSLINAYKKEKYEDVIRRMRESRQ